MWELDADDISNLLQLSSCPLKRPKSGCLSESVIKSIVDPDDLFDSVKPSILQKQNKAVQAIKPLRATFSSHLEPQFAYARHLVWTILNSGSADVRQARKAAVIWGWDEVLFLSVFEKLRVPLGPVTVRKGAPSPPLAQPASYEGAWASKRKREVQFVGIAGRALDSWCSFHDFDATPRRFYWGSGYKEVSAKLVVELAAVLTVDTKRCIGRQSKVTLYVTTMTVNSQLTCLSSPCRWETCHPVDVGTDIQSHAIKFYQNMCDLSTIPSATPKTDPSQMSTPPAVNQDDLSSTEAHRSLLTSVQPVPLVLSHDDDV